MLLHSIVTLILKLGHLLRYVASKKLNRKCYITKILNEQL